MSVGVVYREGPGKVLAEWGCNDEGETFLELSNEGTCPCCPTRLSPEQAVAMAKALLARFDHAPHGTGHDPVFCGTVSEANTLILCECCRGNCPSAKKEDGR